MFKTCNFNNLLFQANSSNGYGSASLLPIIICVSGTVKRGIGQVGPSSIASHGQAVITAASTPNPNN